MCYNKITRRYSMKENQELRMLTDSLMKLVAVAMDFIAEFVVIAINNYYSERGAKPPFPDPIKRDGE